MADKRNLKTLVEYRVKGRKIKVGEVIAKTEFTAKGEWQNLCNMKPPRCEETSDPVGSAPAEELTPAQKAAKTKADKAAAAGKAGMPGAN